MLSILQWFRITLLVKVTLNLNEIRERDRDHGGKKVARESNKYWGNALHSVILSGWF